jgi:alpha-glucosidase
VLSGEVGDFVLFARKERNGNDWYLGAVTDENARSVGTDLDFLEAGRDYEAQIYRDGEDAHWNTKPFSMAIEKRILHRGQRLELKLAPGGGAAVRLKAKGGPR